MVTLLSILTVHFLADFVFQSSKMATEKGKSIKWLSIHVSVYGLVSIISAVLISIRLDSFYYGFSWWAANVILHFSVDFFTSKITSRLWEKKSMHWFFVMIGFDQLLHNASLLGTFYILKSDPLSNLF